VGLRLQNSGIAPSEPSRESYACGLQSLIRILDGSDAWSGSIIDSQDIRTRFYQVNEGFDLRQSDEEFLREWGYVARSGKKFLPTRAAIPLIGSLMGVRQLIPKPILDVQFLPYGSTEEMPETRWIDRFISEENIVTPERSLCLIGS
jgi:hypothetical protein